MNNISYNLPFFQQTIGFMKGGKVTLNGVAIGLPAEVVKGVKVFRSGNKAVSGCTDWSLIKMNYHQSHLTRYRLTSVYPTKSWLRSCLNETSCWQTSPAFSGGTTNGIITARGVFFFIKKNNMSKMALKSASSKIIPGQQLACHSPKRHTDHISQELIKYVKH